ncbi:NTP transferase domain-containing protein [Halomarina halobia]|uniref:NTP transferase domain-containing protein n=1 Tax=Halomarina halobia TaxID=3033386 RepID=A0ABD6AD85_9EURY|nr:nucleotidyltransferase family protein [Halomarina sp. PSR21]
MGGSGRVTGDEPPVVAAAEVTAARTDEASLPSVAGVVLAAGTSSRFGAGNKLLAELDGEPLVRRAVRTLLDATLGRVIVVLGHESASVREALSDLDVPFVENPRYEAGQSTSVRAGVRAVAETDATAAVFLSGDMPFVDPETVDRLVEAYSLGVGDAIAAAHAGRRGNPVLFDRRHFDALRGIEGDVGGRSVLLGSDAAALLDVDDPGVTTDVDTPNDLARHG